MCQARGLGLDQDLEMDQEQELVLLSPHHKRNRLDWLFFLAWHSHFRIEHNWSLQHTMRNCTENHLHHTTLQESLCMWWGPGLGRGPGQVLAL